MPPSYFYKIVTGIFSFLAHIIFPQHCPACGRLAVPYCRECIAEAAADVLPPFCAECGGPYGVNCCYDSVPCYAAAQHDGNAREFILALKYKNMRPVGAAIGREMAYRLPRPDVDVLVPLPLHRSSSRGFNQTELIAQGMSCEWNIPVDTSSLRWRSDAESQTNKRGAERSMLPFESFEADDRLCGLKAALIDDVYTTGGTVRAAKFAMHQAGVTVSAVYVWTRRLKYPEPEEA